MSVTKPDVFPDRVTLDGQQLDVDVASQIRRARLIRPYDGATSVELTIHDPYGRILRSGLLTKAGKPTGRAKGNPRFDTASWARVGETKLVLDGFDFRLAGISGNAFGTDLLTLTFEDAVATKLRRYRQLKVITRSRTSTRAQFIVYLCQTARVIYDIPERADVPKIQGATAHERAKLKRKGIDKHADLTIKGEDATKEQIRLLEKVLAVADEEKAGDRATLALLVACIQESTVHNLPGGDADSEGILQLRVSIWGRELARDVEGSAKAFLTRGFWGKGGAVKLAADNPDQTVGWIAQQVQGSAVPSAYDPWATEAQVILDAWGGAGPIKLDRQEREFRNPKGHSFWRTMGDLAREVDVRCFATENVLNYVSDDYLIGLEPVFVVGRDEDGLPLPGILNVQFDADIGKPVAELIVTAVKPRWTGRAGIPVAVKGMGTLDGRWLIANVEEDLYGIDPATVTLRRPSPQLPEPAEYDQVIQTETTPERGSVQAKIVQAAEKALSLKAYMRYVQVRPMPSTLFPEPRSAPRTGAPIPRLVFTDCSGFVTLCYKWAGAPDPNNVGYDGSGFTGTLWANGQKTNDPQPGDLAFYGINGGGADHVGVYVGKGKVIEFGGPGGPYKLDVHYRSDFSGYRTYPLS